jgi:hypothetical protein
MLLRRPAQPRQILLHRGVVLLESLREVMRAITGAGRDEVQIAGHVGMHRGMQRLAARQRNGRGR